MVERVWGGNRLATEFGRTVGDQPIGESWEIHGDLKVVGSDLTLDQLAQRQGPELLGTKVDGAGGFPILTKWLDCRAWLSVQVHPDDALAREFTGDPLARGKTEAWYVHRADDDSELIHGMARGADPAEVGKAHGEAILPLLNRNRPSQGSLLHTPAGVVHALGPGSLIYEVQQSCDLTYRFYDWGRDRETHLEKALRCLCEAKGTPSTQTQDKINCPYFEFELLRADSSWRVSETSFQILATTSEAVTLGWSGGERSLAAGSSVLLPASIGEVSLKGEFNEPVIRVGVPS